jgi:hypothetical protein
MNPGTGVQGAKAAHENQNILRMDAGCGFVIRDLLPLGFAIPPLFGIVYFSPRLRVPAVNF